MNAPLQGLRVLVTRPRAQSRALCEEIARRGGQAVAVPLLEIEPLPPDPVTQALLADLPGFDLAVFVSANAVTQTFSRLAGIGLPWPRTLPCVAIGVATRAALARAGAEVVATGRAAMNSEELLAREPLLSVVDKRILLLRGAGGRTLLADALRERGARLQECALYRRVLPVRAGEELAQALRTGIDALLVSSGETLGNLLGLLDAVAAGTIPAHPILVVPGARVAAAARGRDGFELVVADNAADAAMLAALERALAGRRERTGDPCHNDPATTQ